MHPLSYDLMLALKFDKIFSIKLPSLLVSIAQLYGCPSYYNSLELAIAVMILDHISSHLIPNGGQAVEKSANTVDRP